MEDSKNNMSELVKLIHKTEKAMEMTREKQQALDEMKEKLMNETRPMRVEEGKKEFEDKKHEKTEFDQMTVNSLRRAKTEILQLRKESENEYKNKIVENYTKKKEIERKLASMERKGLPEEKITMARNSAQKALEKADNEMKDYQNKHFVKRAKLDEFENKVSEFALELGVDIEPYEKTNETAENPRVEAPVAEARAEEPVTEIKPEELSENEELESPIEEAEEDIIPPVGGFEVTDDALEDEEEFSDGLGEKLELPKVAGIQVKGNKYMVTYERKIDGAYQHDTLEWEKLSLFKGFLAKAKLILKRKEYGIDFAGAMRADVNMLQALNKSDKEKYLSYIAGQTTGCFDIEYDDPDDKNAKRLAKAQERLMLKGETALEQYAPKIDDVDFKQQIENNIIQPELDEEEHKYQQDKYNRIFGDDFVQHYEPPMKPSGATEEEIGRTVREIMHEDEDMELF